ncbi:MAG: hypothetical protein ACJAS2_002066 [Pseudohongiellaceae bacterium]|jgi:hypothetical protein
MAVRKQVEPEKEQANAVINDETAESRTIASRMKIRDKVEEDIARFLSKGGAISEIDSNVTADPPRKPESNYGARAI